MPNFVEDFLPMGVAIQKRFVTYDSIAAIEYVLVGGKLIAPVNDLLVYYEKHSSLQIIKAISSLIDYLDDCWYSHGHRTIERLENEYGAHLPELITLEIRPQSSDLLWPENTGINPLVKGYKWIDEEILLHNHDSVKRKDFIQIDSLKVVRIKSWAVTLEHKKNGLGRVRVEYAEDSGIAENLQIGQVVNVRGHVVTTRQGLLENVVEAAFKDITGIQVSPGSDGVLGGLGEYRDFYPNPLKLYTNVIREFVDVNQSIIHGDLHLRNILIDKSKRPWLIDFGRVRQGQTLFEFIKLESYLRLDILSNVESNVEKFSLKDYVNFEEALASATFYGIKSTNLPTNSALLKAFQVILAIRHLAIKSYKDKNHNEQVKTYFCSLLLYNVSLLKYSRKRVLSEIGHAKEKQPNLQAARLCFIAASVQCGWINNPPPKRLPFNK